MVRQRVSTMAVAPTIAAMAMGTQPTITGRSTAAMIKAATGAFERRGASCAS